MLQKLFGFTVDSYQLGAEECNDGGENETSH